MVLRHAQAPYSDFVLLFHMAIFFIASGYLYNRAYADSVKSVGVYIKKKAKSLYLPYIAYTIVFILLNNLFLHINVYTDNPAFLEANFGEVSFVSLGNYYTVGTIIKQIIKAALFQSGTQMGGAFWFFKVMFLVLIGYTAVEFIVHRITSDNKKQLLIQTLVAIVLLLIGYWCYLTEHSLKGMNRVCSVYILIHLGVLLKQYSVMQRIRNRSNNWITLMISLLVLVLGYHRGYISIADNSIENPLFFVMMSLAGWFFIYSIAELLVERHFKFNDVITYISIHSVPIIALHFLCFKIVSVVAVIAYGMEKYMIAAFPVLMVSGAWWIAYTLVGLSVPLLLEKLVVILIKKKITRRMLCA